MLITLEIWAARHFDPPPKIGTLRAWAGSGLIYPAPLKIGRRWMVDEQAVYRPAQLKVNDCSDRVSRILRGVA